MSPFPLWVDFALYRIAAITSAARLRPKKLIRRYNNETC